MGKAVHVDFSKAKVLEPMPAGGPYLSALSAFEYGKSAEGNDKVHVELTVVGPEEFKNRKLFDDISLVNEFTLGRLMNLLVALGEKKEDITKPGYKIPEPDELMGRQAAVWVSIRESEVYGDRNQIKRLKPASAYKEGSGTGY